MTTIEEIIRAVVREEIRSALAALRPPEPAGFPEYLTVDEAAKCARVHPATVRGWLRDGAIPRHHAGRSVRVRRADLEAHLRAPPSEGPSPEAEAARILDQMRRKPP